ncbi:MAG: glutaminyl-peptide cyclotransferase [Anaerolineales bacterium]
MKTQKIYIIFIIWCLLVFGTSSCANTEHELAARSFKKTAPTYTYTIVQRWPHDTTAFTEGLVFKDGKFYESNGQNGASDLRIFDLSTGSVKARVALGAEYFGEGMTILNGKIFQLTWQNHKGFIYDENSLASLGEFSYEGEGWGLTNDGHFLIMSNGTNTITFRAPATFQIQRSIQVNDDSGAPVTNINELEYIKGEIYANIWLTDKIVQIDPQTGEILGWVDLTGLRPEATKQNNDAVLNGIAYDPANDRLFVAGKLWDTLYEIKLERK